MRIETWYFKQNAMSFFIGLMPVGKYVEYNHHPNFACECDVTCKDYFYLSSTSLPGGNQVDGLPPAQHDSQSRKCSARRVILVQYQSAGSWASDFVDFLQFFAFI